MKSSFSRIPVKISSCPYEVVLGSGSIDSIGDELLLAGFSVDTKILVVTNHDVANNYAHRFEKSLNQSGFLSTTLILKAGEATKNTTTIGLIHDAAFEAKLERGSLLIALGGGVVGDMTGFAAATWLRGISVVQIPTSLLAMVDASIGGKTGVNHSGGKNLIGAFHQPRLVLIDPSTLKTLPKREFRAGMAEIIKYAIIGDLELLNLLEIQEDISSLDCISKSALEQILFYSASSKVNIVVSDEKESGIRAILNYGHTFGHVIENLSGYGTFLHGEAVAIGMWIAAELSVYLGKLSKSKSKRQSRLIDKANLPRFLPDLDTDDVLRTLQGDKKVKEGKVRFILPNNSDGVDIVDNITSSQIRDFLLYLKSS